MVRGSSWLQTAWAVLRGSPTGAVPHGTAAATAGLRRKRTRGGGASASSGSRGLGGTSGSNMPRFYTDEGPGLKITPTVALVTSLCFIGFVTALHVIGKFYRCRSGGA